MSDAKIPTIDPDAMLSADLAFISSAGPTTADRVRSAVFAYLYATENRHDDGDFVTYPSVQEIADAEEASRA
jgi:hypothetical protein